MNKIVLITGATSGIGLGCARKFAANGDKLILTGRNEQRLEEIRKELTDKGTQVLTLVFDVRDREKATQCINGLPEEWKAIDVLVNNAGLALGLEPEYEGSFEDWETMIDTNIKGLLTMTRLIVPGMVERDRGHIINIGSVAGDAAYANGNVYCATKSAVKTINQAVARFEYMDAVWNHHALLVVVINLANDVQIPVKHSHIEVVGIGSVASKHRVHITTHIYVFSLEINRFA